MDPLMTAGAAMAGYLLGSISFARLVGRLVSPGTDVTFYTEPIPDSDLVFEDDAVSATLVNLHLGARYGCLTAILDMLKSALPTLAFWLWAPGEPYYLIAPAMALVGHNWPLYHRFRGGRGESVVYGSLLVIDPLGAVLCNVGATALGLLVGSVHVVRWGGIVLLIPWLGLRGGAAHLAYILFANLLFWISMRKEVAQYIEMHRQRVFQTQEELAQFLDMGGKLGRVMDRVSLPALLARRDR